jgi:hypothetical protein
MKPQEGIYEGNNFALLAKNLGSQVIGVWAREQFTTEVISDSEEETNEEGGGAIHAMHTRHKEEDEACMRKVVGHPYPLM